MKPFSAWALRCFVLLLAAAALTAFMPKKDAMSLIVGRWETYTLRVASVRADKAGKPNVWQVLPGMWKTVAKVNPPRAEYFADRSFVSRYLDTTGAVTKEVRGTFDLAGDQLTLHSDDPAYDGLQYTLTRIDEKEMEYRALVDLDGEGARNDTVTGISRRLP